MSGAEPRYPPPSTLAAPDAYDEAGIGPDDIDLVECQAPTRRGNCSPTRSSGCALPANSAPLDVGGT